MLIKVPHHRSLTKSGPIGPTRKTSAPCQRTNATPAFMTIVTTTMVAVLAALVGLAGAPDRAYAARHASMVIDGNTGKVLSTSNPDLLVYPASLTKMMTLFIVFDELERRRLSYKTRIKASAKAAAVQPSKLGLKPGETISVQNAIKALITKSANDVAIALGEHISGSEAAFARRMTKRARELGMRKTVFKNASGLPNTDQVTTARDMTKLGLALIDVHAKYYHLFSLRAFTYKGRRYGNHNGLLRNYPGTDGLKTGYTRASGFNLVASVRRKGKHLIGAVFGGKSSGRRNREMRALLTKAFPKASPSKSRRFQRQRNDLVARVKVRRTPSPRLARRAASPRLAKRPQRIARTRQRAARKKLAQLQPGRRPAAKPRAANRPRRARPQAGRFSAPPIRPAIRMARVRTINPFAALAKPNRRRTARLLPAGRVMSDLNGGLTTKYRTPARLARTYRTPPRTFRAAKRLPRQQTRENAPTAGNVRPVTLGRRPSTFQQQAALLATPNSANSNPVRYAPPRARLQRAVLRPALLPSGQASQTFRAGTQRNRIGSTSANPTRQRVRSQATRQRSRQDSKQGDYQVQIGAYGSMREAESRIATVRASSGALLTGYGTVTIPFDKANRRYYRARFAGFDNKTASATCQQLRQRKVDCFVAKAH